MLIDVKLLQPAKARLPMTLTELGMLTDVKLQPLNVPSAIMVTELGMLTDVKLLQLWNA
jgi:hypothetical protein